MITHSQKGPELPTLFERFADRLPLPYPWLCLILAVIPGYGASNFGQNLVDWGLWSLLAFYMFYIIRYMRLRVIATETEVVPLCPDGEATFHEAFGRLSHLPGQILSMFAMASLAIFYFLRLFRFADFFHLTFVAATVLLFGVAFGSAFWVYLSSLIGVYDLGKKPLKLKSFYEDAMLGVRPLGSLSLQLTILYLGLSGVAALATVFFPDIVSILLLSGLTVLGVVLFFYPLTGIHRLMQQEKDREHALIRRELADLVQKPKHQASHSMETTLADLEILFRDFRSLLALDLSERKVLSVPTWPYDSKILSELTIVLISVTATIVAQIIIVALHL